MSLRHAADLRFDAILDASSKVRTVPPTRAVAGITFQVSPPWIWVTLRTAVSSGSMPRDDDGLQRQHELRRDRQGVDRLDAAWRHARRALRPDDLENVVGGEHRPRAMRELAEREPRQCCACRTPPRPGTFSNRPSSTMRRPPPSFSSAGWKMKCTVPSKPTCLAARYFAAPSSMAVCPSWPQACILPGMVERGRSHWPRDRQRIHVGAQADGAVGLVRAFSVPTTPVLASPR